jgi:hypothetical protein
MKKIFKEKYLYLLAFILVAIGYVVQMVYFSRFLSDSKNYTVFTAWALNQELRRDIHDHPERYPDYNPDGTLKPKMTIVEKKGDVRPEISNAFVLSEIGMVPFFIDDASRHSITNIASTLDKPAGQFGFIRVKDGHFYNDKGRFQIAGINNVYEANFPSHEYADVMSLRLARFGFNCVRLHHCDEKGFWTGSSAKTIFNENKFDLFDYNIAALKKQGIYVNINLHCSRQLGHAEGVIPSGVIFDKGIDNFDSTIKDLNKKFASDLLNHVNPYTGNAYKNEPAVALIEINNENSICQIWRNGSLEKANEYYLYELRDMWNTFLKKRYGNDEQLRKEVGFATIPFGEELLNGTGKYVPKRKTIKLVNKNNISTVPLEVVTDGALYLEIKGVQKDIRQLVYDGLTVKKGQLYTFSVTLRTNVPSSVLLRHVFSNKKGRTVKMYTQGKFETYDYTFIAEQDDDNFRLSIGGFLDGVTYHIESLSFKEGGSVEYPQMDDRPIVAEESFDVYTTSLVNNKPLKTLATINIQKIIDGVIVPSRADLELRARANKKYRIDMLVTASIPSSIDVVFRQRDQVIESAENYNSFESAGVPYVLSYTIESQHDENIALCIKDKQRSATYKIDILQVKPIIEQSNEKISLDSNNIPILFYSLISRYPVKLQNDWCEFLMDIDKSYWNDMYDYLKNTIGAKQLVTGTQIEYGSMHSQAKMDYCDIHGYWDHPVFPNVAWNEKDWFCHNQPIINVLDKSPLLNMATKRIVGKPYTCSEYGHIWINRYSAEGLPLISLLGSRHGWDGIFPFCYDDGNVPDSKAMVGYFTMRNNTVQLAHQIACNNLLTRDYNKNADKEIIVAPLSEAKELELFQKEFHTYSFGFNGLDLDMRRALISPTGIDPTGTAIKPQFETISNDNKELIVRNQINPDDYLHYNSEIPANHWLSASQGKTQIFTGFVERNCSYPFGGGYLEFSNSNLQWATVTMTEVRRDAEGVHYLLVITGEMRNTDQVYQQILDNKITLNNSGIDTFGGAPVLCECLSVLFYTHIKSDVVYYVLDEAGNRIKELSAVEHDDSRLLYLLSENKTIWYEIVEKQGESNATNTNAVP